MAAKIRSVDFLPEIFQTPVNKQFLSATLDQLVQEPNYKQTQGFIGQKVGPGVNPNDGYVIEPTQVRNNYQLEPGIVSVDPTTFKVTDGITYPGIINALAVEGGITDQADRLFESEYYTWDPFVDFDKYNNYAQYFWLPSGPDAVTVAPTYIPTEQNFTVTRSNGAYTFTGYAGANPELTLVRNGNYNFVIAQNEAVTIQYRVTNNATSSWNIDFQNNPTLTLIRGNTYVFDLVQTAALAFYIKTSISLGTENLWTTGVINNGGTQGLVTFTVPQDAPDTLYYCNDAVYNLQGQFNIVSADPGTGPDFWIQSEPGVNGTLPWSNNISSRDVLGVGNNGTDLGTVTFSVPDTNAQNFYYSMPYIGYPTATTGQVDLICSDIQYNQINGITVSQFFADYPTGIDGVTSLNGSTMVFVNQSIYPDAGGWFYEQPFDPLASGQNLQIGAFDSTGFSEATPITDTAIQSGLWQIQYVPDNNGVLFIQLTSILPINNLNQFIVTSGTEYVNTQWYKDSTGVLTQMPLLTAAAPQLYYQDSEDPTIFGTIKLIEGNTSTASPALSITGLTASGSQVTLSFAQQSVAPYAIGATIIVSEINPAAYNGDYTVLACTATSVTYANTYTESYVSGGVLNSILINSYINVDTDILGKTTYTSPNGVAFTNGLKVLFEGNVYPLSYVNTTYYVQGVGTGIVLVPEINLIVVEPYATDNNGQPIVSDYMTINMASPDLNPWSRSNRWFHTDVINYAASLNGTVPDYSNAYRANRPILEFRAGLKLINFGTEGIPAVNIIDFTQTDALLNVNGKIGYSANGYTFVQGSLVIFAADTNPNVRNQIYTVNFITPVPNSTPVIDLVPVSYSPVLNNQTTVCLNGTTFPITNAVGTGTTVTLSFTPRSSAPYAPGQYISVTEVNPTVYNGNYMVTSCTTNSVSFASASTAPYISGGVIGVQGESFYYNGTAWVSSQQKTAINQPPLFDIFDSNGYSFSDNTIYPSTNFTGCKLLSYAENADNSIDSVLGIPLSFFSIDNIGDILFANNLYTDTFVYTPTGTSGQTIEVSSGFVYQYSDRINPIREIGWKSAAIPSLPRQQFEFTYSGLPLQLDILVNTSLNVTPVQIFVNNEYQLPDTFTLSVNANTNTSLITLNSPTLVNGDIIEVLVYSQQVSTQGFYQIPINLENNPFNGNSAQFSLGTVRQHYASICENLPNLVGPINGRNNTRDLGDISTYGGLILQQSSPLTLAGFFLRNPSYDIFAALSYNSREYIKYKNKLLTAVTQLNLTGNETVAQILDLAITQITKNSTSISPFYWSDMLPIGTNFTSSKTTINPITGRVFNTSQMYDFTSSNYLGLLVYVNNILLLRGSDYIVSPDSPKLTILAPLKVGDVVTINEYPTTVASWCPNTPSKMGLYPKYTPSTYIDDTYSEPTVVIQGHDGSITIAFGDIRDQVLYEFEKRIYNNIKVDDNPIPLTTDQIDPTFYPAQTTALLPGYFRSTPYTYAEVNQILSEDFLTWVGQNKVDYTTQNYDANNPFTYNYIQSANRLDQTQFLQGNWRGIYRYFYDTETPNSTPWEMVGFTEEPSWWVLRYGPAPYTSGNEVLWGDLEAGIVGDPAGPYILPEYIRPGLSKVIPAGPEGELLPPTECIMGKTDPYGFQQSWVAGDGGPVQASWWNSSSYPFAMMRLMALTKPAEFFALFADRDLYRYNTELGQYLLNNRYRLDAAAVQVYGNGVSKASYINWVVDYNQQLGINSTTALTENLANLDVRLCYRMASFSDPVYVQVFTERAGPSSTNNSLLIPPSSYDLLFYKNQPFNQITYSSVIVQVEQLASGGTGYGVYGYSNSQPYFEILVSSPVGLYSTITSGDISVQVPSQYTTNTKKIPYGYVFTSLSSVCDFLLSYGAWLEGQGLIFNNMYNGYILNWNQMAQEFLYFANQGWQSNTMINLNPCATTITASQPISIVDTIASLTPENMLLDQNRKVLDVSKMVVNRDGNLFSVTTTNGQTINYLTLKFTNYEDMIVFNNVTQYTDLIYDPVTAARQVRLSLIASTTIEWDGQLNAQGFILNLNNVQQWKSYTKYTKGDMVLYKNTYWQALTISEPQITFNYNEWIKTDYQAIDTGLLPNLANKADQLTNAYNVYQANLTSDNDLFAFGLIGFRPRPYMTDMNLNAVTQVQLYQQFIGTKGSLNAAEIFNSSLLNGKESGAYNIFENWAILSGTYGANANKSYFEVQLNESLLSYNPSTIQITDPGVTSQANQQVYLNDLWKESYAITSPDILPTTYETDNSVTALPSAGYVCLDDVDVTVFSLEDPSEIAANISGIGIGTYIWIAKVNSYDWGVYRVASVPAQMIQLSDNLNGTSIAQFSAVHGLSVADLIVIKYFNAGVNGVYRVLAVPTPSTMIVSFSFVSTNATTVTGTGLVFHLQSARVSQASDISTLPYVNDLLPGAIAWVDNDGTGRWEAVKKQSPFTANSVISPDISSSSQYGVTIAQSKANYTALIGAPNANSGVGSILTYFKGTFTDYQFNNTLSLGATNTANFGNMVTFGGSVWAIAGANSSNSGMGYAAVIYRNPDSNSLAITQLLVPPDQNFTAVGFGTAAAISEDEQWMYVGAPAANTVYAYTRVNVLPQSVSYTTTVGLPTYNYANAIQINSTYPNQLLVTLGGNLLVEGVGLDYTIDSNNIILTNAPVASQSLLISRRLSAQFGAPVYYNILQDSTSGSGINATFNITNTLGVYSLVIVSGGVYYSIGDTVTINGTQLGGTLPANNLTITVASVNALGSILGYTIVGTGASISNTFALAPYLYNATNIQNFTVSINGVLQRPYFDYTFDSATTNLTLTASPPAGATLIVSTNTYWQYVTSITSANSLSGDQFGASISTTTDGSQIYIGAPAVDNNALSNSGVVYVFDRSVARFIVSNPSQMIYTVLGSSNSPLSVNVNGEFLLASTQAVSGQYTASGSTVTFTNITFNYGDIIEIGTNNFVQIQQLSSSTPIALAGYGSVVEACPLDCSLYLGAPSDSTYYINGGSVDHQVNQSRVYGVTTSTVANPNLPINGSIRINNTSVVIPAAPNNTVRGLADAINAAAIPNVAATATPDLTFIGDGSTQVFYIGALYSSASSYTPKVYLGGVEQLYNTNYSYDPSSESIYFVYAPLSGVTITVLSGRLTISVENYSAGVASKLLTVLPGVATSIFDQLGFNTFVFAQQIVSPLPTAEAYFGSSLSIDTSAINLIVGAPNGSVYEPTTFDQGQTYFDEHSTIFFNPIPNGGVAYTYDYLPSNTNNVNNPGQFAFGQQIYNNIIQSGDFFATAVNYTNGRLLVGAPGGTASSTSGTGYVVVFDNPNNSPVWKPIRYQQPVADVNAIDGVFSYNLGQAAGINDTVKGGYQTYFDFFDPLQGKILGIAKSNLDYIGAVDPAQYNQGTIHNNGQFWAADHIGQMWWDTDTVRFIDPSQDDIVYASRRWGTTFPGSAVDVYQWIESTTPPSGYTGLGTPLSITSYNTSIVLGSNNIFATLYYFWVKGSPIVATGSGKTLSSAAVASYILDPRSSGIPYIAAINASTIAIYNAQSLLSATNTILNVSYSRQLTDAVVHQEYQMVTDGIANSFLNTQLYRKFIESLSGITVALTTSDTSAAGKPVPDPTLSPGMKYGVQFRPRQSMFADRFSALENYLGRANSVLSQYPISEIRSFNLLNSAQPIPDANSGAWDFEVANLEILGYQNLVQVPLGYKYLVINDSNQQGRWSIYTVVSGKTLLLTQVQSYDTPLYWYYVNWYLPGYNSTIAPVAAVQNYGLLATLSYATVPVGLSVRVLSNGAGKWEIYLRTGTNNITDWQRVGLEDGTIAFSESLWNYPSGNFGFDAQTFDSQYFDETPQIETSYIIRALNEEIYIEDLLIERNSSLILMFNYVYSEFTDPSWLLKTSYVDVNHSIRSLLPYQTYLADNQDFVLNYFQEVKPYHVQTRQFNLIYNGDDNFQGDITDFDLPAYWQSNAPNPQFVSPILTPYNEALTSHSSLASNVDPSDQLWISPTVYSQWFENYTLSVQEVLISNAGLGYTTSPLITFGVEWQPATAYDLGQQIYYGNNLYTITVSGTTSTTPPVITTGSTADGSATLAYAGYPATGTCIINTSGSIISITVTNPGSGYITDAIVNVAGGGLPSNPIQWAANIAVVSNSYIVTPTNNIFLVSSAGSLGGVAPLDQSNQVNGTAVLTFVGQIAQAYAVMGNPAGHNLARTFNLTLKYDRYEYSSDITEWVANTTYPAGSQIRFNNVVYSATSTITNSVFDLSQWTVVAASTLSGINRTMGYYVSTVNTPGLNLPLLIDGIDYPGVQISALNFSQDTGYARDNFDSNPFDNFSLDANGQPTYDLNLLDTVFKSSYLDPYLGTRPSDINVDGGKYVDVYESHAPEELVPGIEFDTLDFRVYTTPGADWQGVGHSFPESALRVIYNSSSPTISFAGQQTYPTTLSVTDFTQGYDLTMGSDYTIDWVNQIITVLTSSVFVQNGDQLGVYVYELGGGNQVYKNTYNGSAVDNSLVIPVSYYQVDGTTSAIQEIVIFVNGVCLSNDAYSYSYYSRSSTQISFSSSYTSSDFISLVVIEPTKIDNVTTNYSWSVPVTQNFTVTTAGQTVFNLNSAFNMSYTNPATAIVTVGGAIAVGPAGIPYVGDGTTYTFALPTRVGFTYSSIVVSNVSVYVSGILLDSSHYSLVTVGSTISVVLDAAPLTGKEIYISVNVPSLTQYIIDPIANTLTFLSGTGITPQVGQLISVTSFNDTREQRLSTQVIVGPVTTGSATFQAFDSTLYDNPSTTPSSTSGNFDATTGIVVYLNSLTLYQTYTDISRPWIALNGKVLTPFVDYTITGNVLELISYTLQVTDIVMITNVTSSVVPEAMEFRIFQDMRGVQATYRMTPATTTTVTRTVTSTDDIIYVANAGALTIPNFTANTWGVVTIGGERIMYRDIDITANTISSLLRGTAGTAASPHVVGDMVYDMGRGNILADNCQDYIISDEILGDGITTVFTTSNISLAFTGATTWVQSSVYTTGAAVVTGGFYYRAKIKVPANTVITNTTYWQPLSSEVQVYIGGELQTSGYSVTAENPVTVTFTTAPADGVEVTILVRRGVTWYASGSSPLSASNGIPLQETNTDAALFLQGVI